MKMRKGLLLMLSVLLVSMLFVAACGKTEEKPPAATPPPSEASGNDKEGSDQEATKGPDRSAKYDIEFFVPSASGGSIPSADKDFVKQTIDEMFNVNWNVTYMAAGPDSTNKINARFASNTAPDLMVVSGRDSQTYAKDGLIGDLRPFLSPEKMPNYFKWITESDLKGYYTIEGAAEGLRAPIPYNLDPYVAWYIRKDWLDNLGLEVPKNYEEALHAMRAFTFEDPDRNGKDDTYGFSTSGNGANVGFDWLEWVKNDFYSSMFVDEGQLIDAGSNIRTVDALRDIKSVVDEKIVDPNWFLNKGSDHQSRFIEGRVGIIKAQGRDFALEGSDTSVLNRMREINPNADIIPFNPFPDKKGIISKPQGSNGFVIPVKLIEKEPEKVTRMMEILEFLASPEGFLLTHYGKEGESYTRDGDKVTLKPDVINEINEKNGRFLEIYYFFTNVASAAPIGLEIINPNETDRDREIVDTVLSYKHVSYAGGAYVTPPAGINIADYRKEMNATLSKLVFGDLPMDGWEGYLNELLTKHKGKDIFDKYSEQIRAVGGFETK
ncbi:extracellular solute-binding protein [Paenibacillus sp. IITD108]|uniref:extracellular solute-binding protein n=1 Tax=Paenibacillus sp. IITD108 TaxID=3116649 RepID=UPI002F3F0EBE